MEELDVLVAAKIIRHIGLTESIHLLACSLGWELDQVEDVISPVIAEGAVESSIIEVPDSGVAGVQQIGRSFVNGEEKITLVFRAAIGEKKTCDTIENSILGVVAASRPDCDRPLTRYEGGNDGSI